MDLQMGERVVDESMFRAKALLFCLLPFKLAFALSIYMRRASPRDTLDNHFVFFCGQKVKDRMTWMTEGPLSKKYFNEIAYFLALTHNEMEIVSRFDRINWGDRRDFFANRFSRVVERFASGYSMYLLARLHEVKWVDPQPAAQRALAMLVRKMLEHRHYEFEEGIIRGRTEIGDLGALVPLDVYVPNFFCDKELVRTLSVELNLRGVERTILELDAEGKYWEFFPENSDHRETVSLVSLFYAYRHLTLHTYHNGDGHLVPTLCRNTMETQRRLQRVLPIPSSALSKQLEALNIDDLSDVKLLSPDWAALIGHLGHLNVHLMMREMGWWSGKPILLVYKDRIANRTFLSLFKDLCPILELDANVSSSVWHELAGLTPFIGVSHQIFEFTDGRSMYWNDAGGMAVADWETQDRGFPMREIYDRRLQGDDHIIGEYERLRSKWGMTSSDWHVCLHMRDGNTRGERDGLGESIRNTSFINYVDAMRDITERGGWIVRMGGPKTQPLPKMDRVIDYAHDIDQTPAMDIHLMRTARMFIGTTSGFAYVASSFGIPTAMVNAISSVGLLWSKDTRFSLKPILTKEGRMLTQRDVTSEEWRWAFPTHESLAQAGLTVRENSPDEILETSREVFALTSESSSAVVSPRIERWRSAVAIPGFYGSALPSAHFLEKYGRSFLPEEETAQG